MGSRPAGLAHRVLGDGGGAARARLRDPRRRHRTWSSPTTRTRRPRRAPPTATPLARLWVHNGMVRLDQREDGQVGRQHLRAARGARALRSRCADHVLLRRPLPPADRVRRRAPGRGRRRACTRIREAARRLVDRPLAAVVRAAARALLRRAGQRLQHPARRSPRLFEWVREANRIAPATWRRRPARDARCARAREPARRSRSAEAPTRRAGARETPARPRGPRATSPRPTGCASSCASSAGRSATAPTARAAAGDVIVYGRNPGPTRRSAARARSRACGRRRTPPASRGCRACGVTIVVAAEERRAAVRLGRASGDLRRGLRVPLRRRRRPAAHWTRRCSSSLDQVQDPQNLGAICRTRRVCRRRRRGAPGAALGRRHRRPSARHRRAPSSICPSPPCATSPTSSRTPRRAELWCYGADAGALDAIRRRRLLRRVGRSCSAPRAVGCGRAWRRRATRSSRFRCVAGSQSLSVSAAAAVLLYAAAGARAGLEAPLSSASASAPKSGRHGQAPALDTRGVAMSSSRPGDKDQLELKARGDDGEGAAPIIPHPAHIRNGCGATGGSASRIPTGPRR